MELINKHQYAIGVVARRTQTHPETIRVWERRYELIVPGRSETGRRLYSENDIAKLTLVKRLTELGHSVSSLAKLSNDDLRDRLNASLASEPSKYTEQLSKLRVVFANDALRLRLSRDLLIHEDINVVDFPNKNLSSVMEQRADIVIVDLVTLNEESLSDVRHYLSETGCESALVIFNFGTKKSILELEDAGVVCLKGSVAAAEIYRACRSIKPTLSNSRPALNQPVTSPRFTNEQLSRIAALTSKIACECPNHLAELIINLTAFEKYSSECANRNEEDAQLHSQLNQAAGASRLILEESLIRLMEIEGIEV
ncbi:MAG: MerR family transcriptional regulator [Sulfuritalea sp.]|nr:MerR family transcriptional regulator [Polynucleobacter sp.]MCF8188474.1 MerR family transcriptional regulator [Sulfuritalea sp.]